MVVYSYKTADEGEDFAEGNENGRVDDADWREGKGGGEQCAPEDAHCDCREELQTLHEYQTILAYSIAKMYPCKVAYLRWFLNAALYSASCSSVSALTAARACANLARCAVWLAVGSLCKGCSVCR